MNPWIPLVGLSVLVGILSALFFTGVKAIVIGTAIPWFGVLAWLLYNEYFVPYQGGGASMWPVALMFAGSVAAVVGASAAGLTKLARRNRPR